MPDSESTMTPHNHGTRNLLRRGLAAAALACLSLAYVSVHAGTLSRTNNKGIDVSAMANKATFGGPSASPGWATSPGATPYTSGNIGFASDGTILWGQGSTKMPLPEGRTADIFSKHPISRAAAAAAIGKYAWRLATPIGAGLAIAQILSDAGLFAEFDPATGKNVFSKNGWHCVASDTLQAGGGGEYYFCNTYSFRPSMGYSPNVQQAAVASPPLPPADENWSLKNCPNLGQCTFYRSRNGSVIGETTVTANVQNVPAVNGKQVQTQEQVEDTLANKIASESGWPSSRIGAVADAVNAGQSVGTEAPTVTGPATVQGPQQQGQKPHPSGGTVTTTTNNTYNLQYTGPTVTVTTTTTTVTNNPDGSTTTETETSEETQEEPKEECEAGSDLAACSKLDTPDEAMPEREENIAWSPLELGFGSGSCPAPFTWTDSLGSHSISLASVCDILSTIIRPLVLAFAALAAAFIVLPRET